MKPNSLTVCMIAVGDAYLELAKITAPRTAQVLDHPVTIVTPPTNTPPHLFKLELFRHYQTSHILLIDSDIVLFDWHWDDFDLEAFNAVPSQNLPLYPQILREIRDRIPEPSPLFNTGLWLAPKTLAPLFSIAQSYLQPEGTLHGFQFNFEDETPTNFALHRTQSPTHVLPIKYNRLHHLWPHLPYLPEPTDAFGIHLLSGTPEQKLARVRDYCDTYPL